MTDELVERLREETGVDWAYVPSLGGRYLVSTNGRLYSKPRGRTKGGFLRLHSYVGGYLGTALRRARGKGTVLAHWLVAETFIGPRVAGMEVCHLNGNPKDNRAENLAYKSKHANEADKALHGTLLRGENTPSRKLTWDQVCEIRLRKEQQAVLAERFGVARSTIQRVQSGQTWGFQS